MATKQFYPLLVWATTLVFSPILIVLLGSFYDGIKITKTSLQDVDLLWGAGFACSLPILVIYSLAFHALPKKISSPITVKLILIGICILGIVIIYAIIFASKFGFDFLLNSFSIIIIGSYSLIFIAASFIFKIEKK